MTADAVTLSVELLPEQTLGGVAVVDDIVTALPLVTIREAVAVQALASVLVTVYVVVAVGDTLVAAVLAALDHIYEDAPDAVSVTGAPQYRALAGAIVGTAAVATVYGLVALGAVPLLTVTLPAVREAGVTAVICVAELTT